jgi:hypothetical protein
VRLGTADCAASGIVSSLGGDDSSFIIQVISSVTQPKVGAGDVRAAKEIMCTHSFSTTLAGCGWGTKGCFDYSGCSSLDSLVQPWCLGCPSGSMIKAAVPTLQTVRIVAALCV